MYNSFTAGTKAEPEKYNNELRSVSQKFKEAGVQAVILDLRYNEGGSMDCVQLLGTILTSADRLGEPMAYLEYNDKNTDKDLSFQEYTFNGDWKARYIRIKAKEANKGFIFTDEIVIW